MAVIAETLSYIDVFRFPCLLPFLKRKCLIFSCSPGWFCAQILWSTPDLLYIVWQQCKSPKGKMFVDFGTLYPHKIVTDVPEFEQKFIRAEVMHARQIWFKSDSIELPVRHFHICWQGESSGVSQGGEMKWLFLRKIVIFSFFFPNGTDQKFSENISRVCDIFMPINGATSRILLCKAMLLLAWCYVMWVWCYAKRFDSFGSVCSPFTYQGC